MNNDSHTTKTQKGRIRAALMDDYGITLPPWLVACASLDDLRGILRVIRDVRLRYDRQEQEANRALARRIVAGPEAEVSGEETTAQDRDRDGEEELWRQASDLIPQRDQD